MLKDTNFFLLIEDYGYSKSRTKIGVSKDNIVSTEIHFQHQNCTFPTSKLEAGFITHTYFRSGSRYTKLYVVAGLPQSTFMELFPSISAG